MAEIQFPCPFCGKSAAGQTEPAGQMVKCAGCAAELFVPTSAPPPTLLEMPNAPPVPTSASEDRRPCPQCGEQIKVGALLCFKCKTRLDEPAQAIEIGPAPVRSSNTTMWILIAVLGGVLVLCGAGIWGAYGIGTKVIDQTTGMMCRFHLYDIHCAFRAQLEEGKAPAKWKDKKGTALLDAVAIPTPNHPYCCGAHMLDSSKTDTGLGFRGPTEAYERISERGVVACDLETNHQDYINVLYKDGRVERVDKKSAEYEIALRATEK